MGPILVYCAIAYYDDTVYLGLASDSFPLKADINNGDDMIGLWALASYSHIEYSFIIIIIILCDSEHQAGENVLY